MTNEQKPCTITGKRTVGSAAFCDCDECNKHWAENVEGYFYCPSCKTARLEGSEGPYDGVCEQCFDEKELPNDQ